MEKEYTPEQKRVKIVMDRENMISSQFAEEIGINTSKLSHILNGRNNPSLDVMQRILNRFDNINPEWLILGNGSIYSEIKESESPSLFDDTNLYNNKSVSYDKKEENKKNDKIEQKQENCTQNHTITNLQPIIKEKKMVKIIVYYDDNSFEELLPVKK